MGRAARNLTAVAPHPPTESEMAVVLGDAHSAFQALVSRAGPGASEWRRYTKTVSYTHLTLPTTPYV